MAGCEWLTSVLGEYAAGELPAPDQAAADRHLAGCPACASDAAAYRDVIRLAGTLPPPAPSPDAATRILAALRAVAFRPGGGAMDETLLEVPVLAATDRPKGCVDATTSRPQ